MMRNLKDGSYLGSPRTRQQSPSSLHTTAAEAVAALRVTTPAARKRALVIAVMLISMSVVVSCKHPAPRIVRSRSCRKLMARGSRSRLGVNAKWARKHLGGVMDNQNYGSSAPSFTLLVNKLRHQPCTAF